MPGQSDFFSRIFDIGIGERDQDFSNGKVMTHETQVLPEGMIPCLERKPNGKKKAKHIREEKEKKIHGRACPGGI